MARKLRPRKGTTLQNNAYTGALAEVTVDTTKNTIVIHDGTTTGGHPLPTAADLSEAKDVLSFANFAAFPATGAVKTVYIAEDDSLIYYWDGTAYVPAGEMPQCLYPLDATLAEIQARNPSWGKPAMSNGDQTGTMTLIGGLGAGKQIVAFPTAIPSGSKTVRFDSGVKVFEFGYAMPDFSGATVNNENICSAYISLVNPATSSTVISVNISSGTKTDLTQYTRASIGSIPEIILPRAGRIAVHMDSATGTFQLETAAGVVELSDNTYSTSSDCTTFLSLYENPGAPAEHAGKTMSASLVTDLAQMRYPLPDGATDIYGNTLPRDLASLSKRIAQIYQSVGKPDGIADLDADGLVPLARLPSQLTTLVYPEAVTPAGTVTTTLGIDMGTAALTQATLSGNPTVSFSGAVSGYVYSHTVELTQDGTGGRVPVWPASVKFANGVTPTADTTAGKRNVWTFYTTDGGTTIFGVLAIKGA